METYDVQLIPLSQVLESPLNPRKTFADMDELTEDVAKRGILQPVLVRPNGGNYELVFGARRFRAAKAAKLEAVPAMVRSLLDDEALELMIVENCKRADIHPLEEAEGYRELHERHGHDVDDIAAKVGKSKAFVYARMKLCALSTPARKAFLEGKISPSVALLVARMPAELQDKATKDVTHEYGRPREVPASFREASELLQREYMLRLHDAPFPKADDELVPAAGPCTSCPKRTGNQRELFDDVKSADVCTDPPCFREKLDAYWERLKETAAETGYQVLSDTETKKVFPPQWTQGGRAHGSGYVDLEDNCHAVAPGSKLWGKPYRQVLKAPLKSGELTVTVCRDQVGHVRKLLSEKEAVAALRKLGLTKSTTPSTASTSSHAAEEKARQRKAKLRKKAAKAAVQEVVAKVSQKAAALDLSFWRLMVVLTHATVGSSAGKRTMEEWGLPTERAWDDRETKKLIAATETLTLEQARGLTLELLLEDRCEWISAYDERPYPGALTLAATHFEVDLKAIEKELAAAEPKPKATKKAAKTRGRKK